MANSNLWMRFKKRFSRGAEKRPEAVVENDVTVFHKVDEEITGAAGSVKEEALPQENSEVIVKKAPGPEKNDNMQLLGQAFTTLLQKLQGINDHLDKQIIQHENIMQRMENLPDLIQSLPTALANQKQTIDILIKDLEARSLKDRQLSETIARIPDETAKQTNSIVEMNQKLSVAADIDLQMAENFNKFNDTLSRIDRDTVEQTEGILQMHKKFQAGDRYLKYIIYRQNRRFTMIFTIAIIVCVFAIFALIVSLLLVLNR